ncbi:hypothetical protein N6H13_01265 [Paenibacillus sp. CC-CFT742]|nr:hypothetical protein [Paenibacillus sp. CC-CFT742]WJH29456.1 hypothetical protein N6H13_01265 [Paenibacillus sp. CC-CFT742]
MTGMASPVEADTGDIRAAWVWQAKSVQDDGGDELLANAAKYKINRLYVNVDMNLSDEVYRTFISKASNAGIAVEALGGDPSWAVRDREAPMLRLAAWVSDYNQELLQKNNLMPSIWISNPMFCLHGKTIQCLWFSHG